MAQNPQYALNQILMNNSNIGPVIDFIKNNGGDLQTSFYKLAKQKGINPEEFIRELMSQ